eukprot:COSAG05_NODE_1570_length_4527_cov_4.173216_4_plen_37_part_00
MCGEGVFVFIRNNTVAFYAKYQDKDQVAALTFLHPN